MGKMVLMYISMVHIFFIQKIQKFGIILSNSQNLIITLIRQWLYREELYNLPFNMNTFSKMWAIKTLEEAKSIIESQIKDLNIKEPQKLED